MNPTIQNIIIPPLKPDGSLDDRAVQRFFEDIQRTFRDKQLADYNSYKLLEKKITDLENRVKALETT